MTEDALQRQRQMLDAVRLALNVRGDEPGRRGAVRAQLLASPVGVIPRRALQNREALSVLAQVKREHAGAEVVRAKRAGMPQALAAHLGGIVEAVISDDSWLVRMDWAEAGIRNVGDASRAAGGAAIIKATALAAETGTLFIAGGLERYVSAAVLVVVVAAADIVGSYEAAFAKCRTAGWPASLALVSGTSVDETRLPARLVVAVAS